MMREFQKGVDSLFIPYFSDMKQVCLFIFKCLVSAYFRLFLSDRCFHTRLYSSYFSSTLTFFTFVSTFFSFVHIWFIIYISNIAHSWQIQDPCNMETFVKQVNRGKSLIINTVYTVLNVAVVLDLPLALLKPMSQYSTYIGNLKL